MLKINAKADISTVTVDSLVSYFYILHPIVLLCSEHTCIYLAWYPIYHEKPKYQRTIVNYRSHFFSSTIRKLAKSRNYSMQKMKTKLFRCV